MGFRHLVERRSACWIMLALLAACSSPQVVQSAPDYGTREPRPAAILEELFRSCDARDWPAFCACIAVPDAQGAPLALNPGTNAPAEPPQDAWIPQEDVQGLRAFLGAPWKRMHFTDMKRAGTAGVVSMSVRVLYDYERIPEAERRMLLGAASARAGKPLDWRAVSTQMRERERMEASGLIPAPRLHFARVADRWRLWLGPVGR